MRTIEYLLLLIITVIKIYSQFIAQNYSILILFELLDIHKKNYSPSNTAPVYIGNPDKNKYKKV